MKIPWANLAVIQQYLIFVEMIEIDIQVCSFDVNTLILFDNRV